MIPSDDKLLADLELLFREGSWPETLRMCRALLALPSVAEAVNLGAEASQALFHFLDMTLAKSNAHYSDSRKDPVTIAAALTGIKPIDRTHGFKGAWKPRIRSAAEVMRQDHLPRVVERPGRKYEEPRGRESYFRAYIDAIKELSNDLHDTLNWSDYLERCDLVASLTRDTVNNPGAPSQQRKPHAESSVQEHNFLDSQNQVEMLARLLPIGENVLAVLNAARGRHQAMDRYFHTSDLLQAILDVPGLRVEACLEMARPGGVQQVRDLLHGSSAPHIPRSLYRPFEWTDLSAIRRAQSLAVEDGARHVDELHIFKAILTGSSNTNSQLAHLLMQRYEALPINIEKVRQQWQSVRTPYDRSRGAEW